MKQQPEEHSEEILIVVGRFERTRTPYICIYILRESIRNMHDNFVLDRYLS